MPSAAAEPQRFAPEAEQAWADALLAAFIFALDPPATGLLLRAAAGPVREHWLALLRRQLQLAAGSGAGAGARGAVWQRLPLHIRDERLLGGLDMTATLQAGRPVAQRGLLADCDGGVLLLPMAERIEPGTAARLAAVLDSGEVCTERDGVALRHPARFGLLALDEGEPDAGEDAAGRERLPAALAERLALRVDLHRVPWPLAQQSGEEMLLSPAEWAQARARHARLRLDERQLEALCSTAAAFGVASLRATLLARPVARAHAALHGDEDEPGQAAPGGPLVGADDLAAAVRLVLLPRATQLPAPAEPAADEAQPAPGEPEEEPPQEPGAPEPPTPEEPPPPPEAEPPPPAPADPAQAPEALPEQVLQAVLASLPPQLLARLQAAGAAQAARQRGAAGVSGAQQGNAQRGRPVGVRRAQPRAGQRLNLVETLRAAVPWQRLRKQAAPDRQQPLVLVRPEDFHITRLRQRRETTVLFAVDASGSAALQRLAEAKGAVELLLADCYARRDQVAVLTFRGRGAQWLLPATRSLVRAKRALSGLPGGGGTPLAAAFDALADMVQAVARRGGTPLAVLLTDGRANVARDGTGGRARAEADALAAARRLRESGAAVLLIDTAAQPGVQAARLAEAAGARYLPLPQAGAQAVSRAVTTVMRAAAQ